jgi:hypothetical protein
MEEARAVDVQRGEGTDQSTMVQSVLLSAASAVFGLLNGRGPWRSKIYAARRTIGMKGKTWEETEEPLWASGSEPLAAFFWCGLSRSGRRGVEELG